ncbi:MAG: TRAP transporter TatT component family protein [Proteobacteria bacterium]|nr:TRAP transporter TatT component family protein [Pseudomonadota bacterium]
MNTTAKVLVRAQPSVQQEADYQLAYDAIPGTLKTIEGFWIVDPENTKLISLLTEGYCQYGTGFVEDDWEVAVFAKNSEQVAYHNTRATHIFSRCLNFALTQLGDRWKREIFADTDTVTKLLKDTSAGQRNWVMWAGLALGSMVNHNLNRVEMISYLGTVKLMMNRILEWDAASKPRNQVYAALPHIALGMVNSAVSPQLGGKPDEAAKHFQMALQLTDNKMLLARTLYAYRVGKQTNDQKLFHEQLKIVLETPPSIWPEQRLANEVAHRRARRYLSHEKEIF